MRVAINEQDGREEPSAATDSHAGAPDPERGGCMRLGWGCLPLIGVAALLPAGLLL
jgi:hypothetical protein